MAATVEVRKQYGTSPGTESSDLSTSGIALKSVDDVSTTPADAPVEILAMGTNYSYESWVKFELTNLGGSSQVDNFKIWGSGAAILGGNVKVTINTTEVDTYATPVDIQSSQGIRDDLVNHGSGSKIDVDCNTPDNKLDAVGEETDFAVFQLVVFDTASPGIMPEQTLYYSYDEV